MGAAKVMVPMTVTSTVRRTNKRFILLSSLQVGTQTNMRPVGNFFYGALAQTFRAASMSKGAGLPWELKINKYLPGRPGCHEAIALHGRRTHVLHAGKKTAHPSASLLVCGFIDFARSHRPLNEFVIATGAKRSGATLLFASGSPKESPS